MALHALSLPRPREAFEPLRNSMSYFLNSPSPSREIAGKALKRIPKVVYIDRQDTSRHLVEKDHEALVGYLRGMEKKGKVEFVHGKFGSLGLKDQVLSVLDADVGFSRSLQLFIPFRKESTLIVDHPRGPWQWLNSSTIHVVRRCCRRGVFNSLHQHLSSRASFNERECEGNCPSETIKVGAG